jgi:hypothetical protein
VKLEKIYTEIQESKQVGTLYHYTSLKVADKILKEGFIKGSDKSISGYSDDIFDKNNHSLSFTRNKNFHAAYRVIGAYPECRFVIDGDALSNKYKIQPAAAKGFEKKKSQDFEAEEIIVSPNPIKVPVKPYVKSIDLLVEPADDLKVGDYNPYKFIEVLKKLKDQGIAVNAVDKNGNSAPTDLKLSFTQWLKKSVSKLTEGKIQEALEVGDKLWADPNASRDGIPKKFREFIRSLYSPNFEPNTKDEEQLLNLLKLYFENEKYGEYLGPRLKDLEPLKSKFPKILDPRAARDEPYFGGWRSGLEGYAWRGARMPITQYEKLIRKSTMGGSSFNPIAIITNPGITYSSRRTSGFLSFTTDLTTADDFAARSKSNESEDYVKVIYGVKLTNPNLVINPDASNNISKYKEYETFYVGNNISPDIILITDDRWLANVAYDLKDYEEAKGIKSGTTPITKFYSTWAKSHTPRFEDFNLDGTLKNDNTNTGNRSPQFITTMHPFLDDEAQAKEDAKKAAKEKEELAKFGIQERINLYEVYTEILTEVGEGTSEPFEYKENFRKGNTFSYLIGSYIEQDGLKKNTPIRLQALAYTERVSGDMEFALPEYFDFLDKPKGTLLNGLEIIFSLMEGDSFAEVNDRVFMYRLMATIKKILQDEFAKSKPDILMYSPGKKGDEDVVDTGRHKLYNAFIKKAFPSAKVFVDREEDEIIYKLK